MKSESDTAQLIRLADQVGNFIEYWGFKKVHGQIWTHIFLSPTPLSALQLIKRLKVSKALVSIAMKDLIHYQLIEQTEESIGNKNKFFKANEDVFGAIKNVLRTRELDLIRQIEKEHQRTEKNQKLSKIELIDSKKLKSLGKMITGAEQTLEVILALPSLETNFFDGAE